MGYTSILKCILVMCFYHEPLAQETGQVLPTFTCTTLNKVPPLGAISTNDDDDYMYLSRNTPSHFMLQKPEIRARLMGHFACMQTLPLPCLDGMLVYRRVSFIIFT